VSRQAFSFLLPIFKISWNQLLGSRSLHRAVKTGISVSSTMSVQMACRSYASGIASLDFTSTCKCTSGCGISSGMDAGRVSCHDPGASHRCGRSGAGSRGSSKPPADDYVLLEAAMRWRKGAFEYFHQKMEAHHRVGYPGGGRPNAAR